MIRIGLVGCGFIGSIHSLALRGLAGGGLVDARVVAAYDTDASRGEATAAQHPGAVAASCLDALVDAVDVIWVATWTAAHGEAVEAAARAGRAVFCEKPLAPTFEECRRVAEALRTVPHQVGLVLRRSPVFAAMAEAVARHGRPLAAVLRDDQYLPDQGVYGSTWRTDVHRAGGGTLIEHSIHDLDLLRWFLGDPETVAARTGSRCGLPGIEDTAVVTLAYPDGTTATLVSVWHQVLTRPSTRRLEVFCEDAFLWTEDDHLGPLHVETSAGSEVVEGRPPGWIGDLAVPAELAVPLGQYAAPSKDFLDALAEGGSGFPDAATALAAHRLVDLAYCSAAQGGVPLPVGTGPAR
ncbi:MAG: Gfo/Idh/MocA family oxidoreductase [Acidimicrobiia bacterium]|nr:Gfo/Idh/MocA family oxidoreductase [Acidimicrobiia bacterium]